MLYRELSPQFLLPCRFGSSQQHVVSHPPGAQKKRSLLGFNNHFAQINCIFSTQTCSPLRPGRSFATSNIAAMTCNAKKHPRLRLPLLPFICFFAHWAPAAFVRHVIPHRRGFVRMAAGEASGGVSLGESMPSCKHVFKRTCNQMQCPC